MNGVLNNMVVIAVRVFHFDEFKSTGLHENNNNNLKLGHHLLEDRGKSRKPMSLQPIATILSCSAFRFTLLTVPGCVEMGLVICSPNVRVIKSRRIT
jgi:hypothetical protein